MAMHSRRSLVRFTIGILIMKCLVSTRKIWFRYGFAYSTGDFSDKLLVHQIFAGLVFCGLLGIASMNLATGDEWAEKADMPTPRWGLSTSAVDGKIYVIGGEKVGGPKGGWVSLRTVEEYDPATRKWTNKHDIPTSRFFMGVSVVNGKIYAIGGEKLWTQLSNVEEYDPETDKWTRKTQMPTARDGLGTVVVNGKIYAIGGGQNSNEGFSTVEEYDPASDTWTEKGNMPTGRYGLGTSAVNGRIYAIGGYDGSVALSTVEEYNPAKDEWEKKADMPTPRWGLSTSVVNGKILAIGGNSGNVTLSAVEEYDPVTDIWTKRKDMPTARSNLSTSAVKGKIYAFGGTQAQPPAPLSTVEEYTPEDWSVSSQGKLAAKWGEIKQDR
jgi:N-acetylneuraminic acid mutarotase